MASESAYDPAKTSYNWHNFQEAMAKIEDSYRKGTDGNV
ncbi:hypothetical protein PC110_g3128 [Phytophthora cactorum]|uniref:Uncharacterized protein n=1 Tax=Phytophthora cactorum TaxID=29920 RepID=A0A329SUS1_9STRA|nr:hypothetical protein PC110_g3128 [Phytophthora cactorum]